MVVHVGILASSEITKLEKCIKSCMAETHWSILGFKLTVFINTRNIPFKDSAIELCQRMNLHYVVTESNGTPALGKNTMVKWFSENTDDDYYIFVDGDDTLGEGFFDVVSKHFNSDIITTEIPTEISTSAIGRVILRGSKVYRHYENLLQKQVEYNVNLLMRVIGVKRSSLSYIKYDEDLHTLEDAHFAFRLAKSDLNITRISQDNTLYVYTPSDSGNFVKSAKAMKDPDGFFEKFWEGLL